MKRIKNSSIILSVLIISVLFISSALGQSRTSGMETVKDEISGTSIDKPAGWIHSYTEQSPGKKALYIRNNTENPEESINILVFAQAAQSKNVSEYAKKLINQYSKAYKTFDLKEKEAVLINDTPFASFLIVYDFEGIKYKMNSIFTVQDGKVYQINIIASDKVYDSEIELINKITGSFKIN